MKNHHTKKLLSLSSSKPSSELTSASTELTNPSTGCRIFNEPPERSSKVLSKVTEKISPLSKNHISLSPPSTLAPHKTKLPPLTLAPHETKVSPKASPVSKETSPLTALEATMASCEKSRLSLEATLASYNKKGHISPIPAPKYTIP